MKLQVQQKACKQPTGMYIQWEAASLLDCSGCVSRYVSLTRSISWKYSRVVFRNRQDYYIVNNKFGKWRYYIFWTLVKSRIFRPFEWFDQDYLFISYYKHSLVISFLQGRVKNNNPTASKTLVRSTYLQWQVFRLAEFHLIA